MHRLSLTDENAMCSICELVLVLFFARASRDGTAYLQDLFGLSVRLVIPVLVLELHCVLYHAIPVLNGNKTSFSRTLTLKLIFLRQPTLARPSPSILYGFRNLLLPRLGPVPLTLPWTRHPPTQSRRHRNG